MLGLERVPLREGDVPGVDLPSLEHLSAASFADVYEPAEDTYLFVDTLHADADFLAQRKPRICIEVGGGSGCVSAALAQVLREKQMASLHLVTDINPRAVEACEATFAANGVTRCDVIRCDLLGSLRGSLVDVLMFNPPYVPTPPEEVGGR
jgi:release factor glutamine methyltransferase